MCRQDLIVNVNPMAESLIVRPATPVIPVTRLPNEDFKIRSNMLFSLLLSTRVALDILSVESVGDDQQVLVPLDMASFAFLLLVMRHIYHEAMLQLRVGHSSIDKVATRVLLYGLAYVLFRATWAKGGFQDDSWFEVRLIKEIRGGSRKLLRGRDA